MDRKKKVIVSIVGTLIVLLALFSAGVAVFQLMNGPGVKTEELDASNAKPATTSIDGDWRVVSGTAPNLSSIGFTFQELLPAEDRVTSGSTRAIKGEAKVENSTLTSGRVEIDMAQIGTDQEKRDINVRSKIFMTDKFPIASFEVTEDVDLSSVGDDAQVAEVVVPGTLTIKDQSNPVKPTFKVVRSGDNIILSTTIHINRKDYNVESPEFIAAKINDEGDINVLLTLAKKA